MQLLYLQMYINMQLSLFTHEYKNMQATFCHRIYTFKTSTFRIKIFNSRGIVKNIHLHKNPILTISQSYLPNIREKNLTNLILIFYNIKILIVKNHLFFTQTIKKF